MSTPRRRRKYQEPFNRSADKPVAVPSAAGDVPNAVGSLIIERIHEDIARRAYQLYEERGGDHGGDWDYWFQADRELPLHGVVDTSLATRGAYAAA
jgi:Protein of unknown function (DUF2934)